MLQYYVHDVCNDGRMRDACEEDENLCSYNSRNGFSSAASAGGNKAIFGVTELPFALLWLFNGAKVTVNGCKMMRTRACFFKLQL